MMNYQKSKIICVPNKSIGHEWLAHLGVGILCPEPVDGAAVGVGREDGLPGGGESFVDVLQDDQGLADGATAVEEHGHLPVHRVGPEQQLALPAHRFLEELVLHALEPERDAHSRHERARPPAHNHHRLRHRRRRRWFFP